MNINLTSSENYNNYTSYLHTYNGTGSMCNFGNPYYMVVANVLAIIVKNLLIYIVE